MTVPSLLSGGAPAALSPVPKAAGGKDAAAASTFSDLLPGAGRAASGDPEEETGKAGLLARLSEIEARTRAAFEAAATPEARQAVLDGAAEELGGLLREAGIESPEALQEALADLAEDEEALAELDFDGLFALMAVVLGGEGAATQPGKMAPPSGHPGGSAGSPPRLGDPAGPAAARTVAEAAGNAKTVAAAVTDVAGTAPAPGTAGPAARGPGRPLDAVVQQALHAARRTAQDGAADGAPETSGTADADAEPTRVMAKTPLGSEAIKAFLQAAMARPEAAEPLTGAGLAARQDLAPPEAAAARDGAQPTGGPAQTSQANGFGRTLQAQIRQVGVSEGTTRVELVPRGLGGIEIEVTPSDDGRLKVVLRAENPAVLQAMRSDRQGLLALLGDSGASVQDNDLEFSDFGSGGQREEASEGAPALAAFAEEDDQPPPAIRPAPAAEGRLDIFT